MTFLLSEITHTGIIMASDSSETRSTHGHDAFVEVEKTLYFAPLNVGISTWGRATVGSLGINEWLQTQVELFITLNKRDELLVELSTFLARQLDEAFHFDGSTRNGSVRMGLHIAGYNASTSDAPGFCHVFVDRGYHKFDAQLTQLYLPTHVPALHLRNGMLDEANFDEFSIMWPALSGMNLSFLNLMRNRYQHLSKPIDDPLRVQAEWIANWVRQLCLVVKMAGIPAHIGKTVRVLAFDRQGNARHFLLPELAEAPVA
jgi:hypothetical protein